MSLKDLTLIMGILISASLLIKLYLSCSAGTFECTTQNFPMVSTIIAQEMYNRLFIFLTAVFMFGVQQTNLRAFYKKLYGVIPNSQNDNMFWLGTASCLSLPLIGIFDEH